MKLLLIEHMANSRIKWYGFTVQKGNFYGYLKQNGIVTPVFWSGWVSERFIYLYDCNTGVADWIGEEDVPYWHLLFAQATWKRWTPEWNKEDSIVAYCENKDIERNLPYFIEI